MCSVLLLAGLAGCATTGEPLVDEWTEKTFQLELGMSPAAVKEILGEPKEVRESRVEGEAAETWIYRQRVRTNSTMKITGTQDRIYIDPITGEQRTVPEPIYTPVDQYANEELRLEWLDGALTEWRRITREEERYQ